MGISRRGSSGAFIYHRNGVVRKIGNYEVGERCAQQGRWLLTNRDRILPRVTRVGETGYDMEPLNVAPTWALDHWSVVEAMLAGLAAELWKRPPVVAYDYLALNRKMSNLYVELNVPGDVIIRLNDVWLDVNWGALHACLTHGDASFDNVMFRPSTGDLVLVDPLPTLITGPAIPDLRCVDVGKVLQSCVGWEAVRYANTTERFEVKPTYVRSLLHDVDDNEWTASVFWCAVHLLRTLPYVDSAYRGGILELVRESLTLV